MSATLMQVLDTTIANVALPHMQAFHARRMDYLRRDLEVRRVEVLLPAALIAQ